MADGDPGLSYGAYIEHTASRLRHLTEQRTGLEDANPDDVLERLRSLRYHQPTRSAELRAQRSD